MDTATLLDSPHGVVARQDVASMTESLATASAESIVGHCLVRLGRRVEGSAMLEQSVETLRSQRGDDHELTTRARRWLADQRRP